MDRMESAGQRGGGASAAWKGKLASGSPRREPSHSFVERFDPKELAALQGLGFKARYVVEGFLSGLHESPFHGFSVEFSDYRNYQPGDDLRHLDWRLFARSDRLCIKRYMQETNVRFYLLYDTSASMSYRGGEAWGTKLECAKVLGAALIWFLLRQNDAVGLLALTHGARTPEFVRPSQRPSHFGLLLRQLELLQPAGGNRLEQLLSLAARLLHRRSVVLIFSDLLEPSERVALEIKHLRFLGHEVVVFQVLDRDEVEFPFRQGAIFEDLESGERRRAEGETVRAAYLKHFEAFMESYRTLFESLEIVRGIVRTDENPWEELARFLTQRRRLH